MTRTTSKPSSSGLVAAMVSVWLTACSLGSDLDVANSSPAGAAGAGGTTGAAGQTSGGSGGPVVNPACAVAGGTSTLAQGAARLDLSVPGQKTWDLEGGAFGEIVKDGVVYNRESHLDYGRGLKKLTVGVQGGEKGVILELGSEAEVATRLLAVAPCTGFDRLAVVDGAFNDPNAKTLFELAPGSADNVTALVGHVYVLRIVRKDERDIVAKLLVTAVEEKSVTFSWVNLTPPGP